MFLGEMSFKLKTNDLQTLCFNYLVNIMPMGGCLRHVSVVRENRVIAAIARHSWSVHTKEGLENI